MTRKIRWKVTRDYEGGKAKDNDKENDKENYMDSYNEKDNDKKNENDKEKDIDKSSDKYITRKKSLKKWFYPIAQNKPVIPCTGKFIKLFRIEMEENIKMVLISPPDHFFLNYIE